MKIFAILIIIFTVFLVNAQNNSFRLKRNNYFTLNHNSYASGVLDSNTKEKTISVSKSKKSPGLAFIYSLLVPGLGHVYANRFETGKYFMISEAAAWLTYAAFSVYGNWLLDDAYSYSENHAGVSLSGKERDDKFFIDIANYNNIDDYNDEKLRFGQYDMLYDPATHNFYWDSEINRKKYREDKLAGDRILNDRLFVIGAVIINHVVSAISAVFAANSYNDDIKKSSGGFSLRAGVQKHFNKIDGISLKLVKWF